jgi:hypothetical protein
MGYLMAEIKTKENNANVEDFINSVKDEQKIKDSFELLKIFTQITGEKPKMWGSSIIGFGKYHYKSSRSSQEGDWPLTGFSPRKQALTIYLMGGFKGYEKILEKIGKYKISSGSCMYVKKLEDVDLELLKKLIKESYTNFKEKTKNTTYIV